MDKISMILAALLLLLTILSTFFFLERLKLRFVEWIVFNACTPSNVTFLIGFVLFVLFGNRIVLHMAILPMFFFGTLGMFVFSWKRANIIPQIAHIIMTLNIVWAVVITFRTNDYKAMAIGLLLGIIVFSVFIAFQQNYEFSHHKDFERIMEDFERKMSLKNLMDANEKKD
ncbi:MAG: hypothetical protein V2A64_00280 [Candidatus Omnitrophota bacterium]